MTQIEPRGELKDVVQSLLEIKARGESAFCDFNGYRLYSDTVTFDSAYKEITGYTYQEYEEEALKRKLEHKRKLEEAIPKVPGYIHRGKQMIYPEKHDEWTEVVVTQCIHAPQHGETVEIALKVMSLLECGATLEEIQPLLDQADKLYYGLHDVRTIVLNFSDDGPWFFTATSGGKMTQQEAEAVKERRAEIRKLKEANAQKENGNSKK